MGRSNPGTIFGKSNGFVKFLITANKEEGEEEGEMGQRGAGGLSFSFNNKKISKNKSECFDYLNGALLDKNSLMAFEYEVDINDIKPLMPAGKRDDLLIRDGKIFPNGNAVLVAESKNCIGVFFQHRNSEILPKPERIKTIAIISEREFGTVRRIASNGDRCVLVVIKKALKTAFRMSIDKDGKHVSNRIEMTMEELIYYDDNASVIKRFEECELTYFDNERRKSSRLDLDDSHHDSIMMRFPDIKVVRFERVGIEDAGFEVRMVLVANSYPKDTVFFYTGTLDGGGVLTKKELRTAIVENCNLLSGAKVFCTEHDRLGILHRDFEVIYFVDANEKDLNHEKAMKSKHRLMTPALFSNNLLYIDAIANDLIAVRTKEMRSQSGCRFLVIQLKPKEERKGEAMPPSNSKKRKLSDRDEVSDEEFYDFSLWCGDMQLHFFHHKLKGISEGLYCHFNGSEVHRTIKERNHSREFIYLLHAFINDVYLIERRASETKTMKLFEVLMEIRQEYQIPGFERYIRKLLHERLMMSEDLISECDMNNRRFVEALIPNLIFYRERLKEGLFDRWMTHLRAQNDEWVNARLPQLYTNMRSELKSL